MADSSGAIGSAVQGFFQSLAQDIDNDLMQKRWKGQQEFAADLKERKAPSAYVTKDGQTITNEQLNKMPKEEKASLIPSTTYNYNQRMREKEGEAKIQQKYELKSYEDKKDIDLEAATKAIKEGEKINRQKYKDFVATEEYASLPTSAKQLVDIMGSLGAEFGKVSTVLMDRMTQQVEDKEIDSDIMKMVSGSLATNKPYMAALQNDPTAAMYMVNELTRVAQGLPDKQATTLVEKTGKALAHFSSLDPEEIEDELSNMEESNPDLHAVLSRIFPPKVIEKEDGTIASGESESLVARILSWADGIKRNNTGEGSRGYIPPAPALNSSLAVENARPVVQQNNRDGRNNTSLLD